MSASTDRPPTTSGPASRAAGWNLEHRYAALPEALSTRVAPTPVRAPRPVVFNPGLARELGLDPDLLGRPEAAALFAGNVLPEGADPIAQAYAGHQFGRFTNLGDGRAVLLGEQRHPGGGVWDIQLKGPGRTPYSRGGDGRAALGPMLREFVVSEAMWALGIPTTRSLAVVATGEPVFREETLPGAVLTRVAASHIRVGTFEFAAARGIPGLVEALLDHAISRHDPELAGAPDRAHRWLAKVMERQASLLARWMCVGFVHGVMNTDNMAISGETIDYGPCAFLDRHSAGAVFSSIDHQGRYAFANQPRIAQWNLARLAETLLPLLASDEARAVEVANGLLEGFPARFRRHWLEGMRAKLGLASEEPEDAALSDALFEDMEGRGADFTNTFRDLTRRNPSAEWPGDTDGFRAWRRRWSERLGRQAGGLEAAQARMRRANPAYIPRNARVEEALQAAVQGDIEPFGKLLEVVRSPYDHDRDLPGYAEPPAAGAPPYRTFCGT